MTAQKKKPKKGSVAIPVIAGILLANVLCFRYVPLKIEEENVLVRVLKLLDQVQNGYGFFGLLLAVFLSFFTYFSLKHIKERGEKPQPLLISISALFGILNVFGLMMYHLDDLPFFNSKFWIVATVYLVCGWAFLFYLVSHWVLCGLEHIHSRSNGIQSGGKGRIAVLFAKHPWAVSFCVILLCWLPWLISYYPASMDWDVYRQMCSALNLGPAGRNNHDPWLASCVLAAFYKLGVFMKNENLGVFLFVFLRDAACAAIYAGCVSQLYKAKIRSEICVLSLLFYAVTPVWGAYAKHAFKDTFATALFCWYIISLITLIAQARKKEVRWTTCVTYCISAVAAALFRNNPIYAIIPTTILLIVFLVIQRTSWLKCVAVFMGILIYFGFNSFIFNYVGVTKGSSAEALSIPIQQTARTVKYHGGEITEKEKQAINAVLNYNAMATKYDPLISDPIKREFKRDNFENGASVPYIKTWLSMSLKYPDTYTEALIGGSYGYYAFTPKLPLGAGNGNSGMTIFNGIKVPAFEKYGFGFHYNEKMQPERDILRAWCDVWDSLPVLSLTNTIAAYTWLAILIGYGLLRRKKWSALIVIVAVGIMFLTCVASPVNDAFRYYSPIAVSVPALLLLFNEEQEENISESERKEKTNG